MTTPTTTSSNVSPLVYTADGRLHDTYRLLDRFRPAPAGSRNAAEWAQRERDIAREERATRAQILAAAADLDPADTSDHAEHLRQVAEQARDHTDADNRRIEWAAAALQADPTLADRLPPAILDAATAHLPAPETAAAQAPSVQTSGAQASGPDRYQPDIAAGQVLGDAEPTGTDLGQTSLGQTPLGDGELPDLGL